MGPFAPMGDVEPPPADYYRKKAEEIRQAAWRAHTLGVAGELFDLADRFDRMAAYVERRTALPRLAGAK
jgi:hypothetical protein